jgi:aubergine-like protein
MEDQKLEKKERKEIVYPTKPKRDDKAEQNDLKSTVICNLRKIDLENGKRKIRQYAIHFEPEIAEDNLPLKKQVLRQLRKDLRTKFNKYFQGGDTLFVCEASDLQEKIVLETTVENTLYKAQFVLTQNIINCRNINKRCRDHIKIKNLMETLVKTIIFANNHIVKFDKSSFFDYFDFEAFGRDGKSKIWHGYSTAVCITEMGLCLRINDKNKMITGKTAYDKIVELSKKYQNCILCQDCLNDVNDYFSGKTVVAQYGSYRAYRIGEVLKDKTVKNTTINYVDGDGKTTTITLKNYYQNQYNINIKNDDQPLFLDEDSVKAEEKKKRYLVPELLYLTGIDELEERDRADIIAKSKFQPAVKVKKIEKGMTYLTQQIKRQIKKKNKTVELPSPDEVRQEWGINFSQSFVEVEARTLSLPELEFADGRPEKPQVNHGRFRQKKDIAGINFDNRNCALITFNHIVSLAKNDCDQFCKACNSFGITFKFPELIKLNNTNKEDLLYELKEMKLDSDKKIVIVILDRNSKNLYPFIKDYLYSERGITSQFMLHDENPNRGGKKKQNMSYYSGVLNQMVVKARGELFRLHFCKGIDSGPSMIIGLDSSRTKDGNKYVLSASYNRKFNRFFTDFGNAKSSPEDQTLCNLIKNALDHFRNINNNYLPNTIIIYRQGGNDKQVEKVMKNELPKIVDFLSGDETKGYQKEYKPKLTVFTVNKKTDMKFFQKIQNGFKNIPMGTVIDKEVISPDVFEFYLQCPDVDRGCASPVHFLCVYNDNNDLSINDFEDISFKQSFYYWNWPGPVRIPAALKYAEVANAFSSKNLTHEVKSELKDSPYYI